ncbi:glycosyltransferase WbuB [Sphingopyxis lindanitolerans]|uniref:Glycosyltransferase WbuB n=1 Tax=Sphingopyxis lindanitolerans TaxID=2054227 RepID=A0A2S8B506_9SPHN|nr:glycosyltransferase family 4 protein [Sphingopyxis lindanitolerans]PQM27430.1 glycosyltransferase WbuB [Sphingopyxis lindanitolerans]
MNPLAPNGAPPRLIVLKQGFDPEPTMKGAAFARRLGELGFDVEVVTGFPNYPGGKVYDGYRIRPIKRMVMQGVAVTRLALYPSHDKSRVGRVLNYASFFLSAALYLTFFARRADVIYAYHPPMTVALAAEVAGFFRRVPVVLDVQDMWPDTLRATGMIGNDRLLGAIGRLCRWTWRRAAHIVVLSNGFRRLLIERGVPADRITVIPNWADEAGVTAASTSRPDTLTEPGKFRVLFAGNMGPAQALDAVLDAAAILAGKRPEVEFCFLGSGLETERLKARAADEGLANVRFLPRVPMAEVGAYLAAADCLLVHLKADPLFAITIPSKTQAYMAAGKPIIMAVEGDAAELVHQSRGGVVVPPEDAGALAEAIASLADMAPGDLAELGANARDFYTGHLSFEQGIRNLADVLHKATDQRKGV